MALARGNRPTGCCGLVCRRWLGCGARVCIGKAGLWLKRMAGTLRPPVRAGFVYWLILSDFLIRMGCLRFGGFLYEFLMAASANFKLKRKLALNEAAEASSASVRSLPCKMNLNQGN